MKWLKEHGPAYTVLKVFLEPGEEVHAEPGALMLLRGDVDVKTSSGGLAKALARRLLGGESFFINTYRARSSAEIWFVPPLPGDVEAIDLRGDEWIIQDTSYLAHSGDIDIGAKFTGFRGLIAEGEFFWLNAKGSGTLWVSSYGAIEKVNVGEGERLIIDNYHFVAMPAYTKYNVRKIGGLKTLFFGGEGLVIEVEGPTTVYVQTRILPPLARLLSKYISSNR
jgi:uncharacterized protein (TIGR00266 family)